MSEPDLGTLQIFNSKSSKPEKRNNSEVLTVGQRSKSRNSRVQSEKPCAGSSINDQDQEPAPSISDFVPVNVITSHLEEMFQEKFPNKHYNSKSETKVTCRWGCVSYLGGAKLFSLKNDAFWLAQHYATKHQDIDVGEYEVQCPHCEGFFYHELTLERHLMGTGCPQKCENIIQRMQLNEENGKRNLEISQDLSQMKLRSHSDVNNDILIQDVCMNTCKFCDMIFMSEKRFKKHLHEDDKGCRFETLEHPLKMGRFDYVECKFCGKTFLFENDFLSHMKPYPLSRHANKFLRSMDTVTAPQFLCRGVSHRYFSCPLCPNKFRYSSGASFRCHLLTDHELEAFNLKCERCGKQFRSKSKLEHHKKINASYAKCFESGDCRTISKRNGVNSPYEGENWNCPFCPKTTDHKNMMLYHVKQYHPDDKMKCKDCNKEFFTMEDYNDHMTKWKCPFCEKICLNRMQLRKHCRNIHSISANDKKSPDPQTCQICSKVFRNTFKLEEHMGFVHSADPGLNVCPFCGETFATKIIILKHIQKQHVQQPSKPKKFVCDICDSKVAFTHKCYLKRHVDQVHKSTEKTECDICHKMFAQKATMLRHRRIHLDIKPFKCDICELTFTQNAGMNAHRARHYNKDGTLKSAEEIKIQVDIIKQQRNKTDSSSKTSRTQEQNKIRKKKSGTSANRRNQYSNADEGGNVVKKRYKIEKAELTKYTFDCKNCEQNFVSMERLNAHRCRKKIARK